MISSPEEIKGYRVALDMSVPEWAELWTCSRSSVYKWEAGLRTPAPDLVEEMALLVDRVDGQRKKAANKAKKNQAASPAPAVDEVELYEPVPVAPVVIPPRPSYIPAVGIAQPPGTEGLYDSTTGELLGWIEASPPPPRSNAFYPAGR